MHCVQLQNAAVIVFVTSVSVEEVLRECSFEIRKQAICEIRESMQTVTSFGFCHCGT